MKSCQTIIFSRNRALQCHLTLSTLFNHCKDIEQESDVFVLYRNDPEHEPSYDTLKTEFPTVTFMKETNFKQDLLKLVEPHESNLLFCTDDTIFTKDFSMRDIVSTLVENGDCLGFSLRLGLNTKFCYPYNCEQGIPNTEKVSNSILKYNWQTSEYDFGYPLELSSSCYRKNDIIAILENCEYNSPNSLESRMSECHLGDKPNLLLFSKSIAFSAPINRVQSTHPNRSANIDPDSFREIYEKGLRIDVNQFNNYVSSAAHELPQKIDVIEKERDKDAEIINCCSDK